MGRQVSFASSGRLCIHCLAMTTCKRWSKTKGSWLPDWVLMLPETSFSGWSTLPNTHPDHVEGHGSTCEECTAFPAPGQSSAPLKFQFQKPLIGDVRTL